MIAGVALTEALSSLPIESRSGNYFRRVDIMALMGMKTGGSLPKTPTFLYASDRPNRYNKPGIHTLYVGETDEVAEAEVKQNPGLAGFSRVASPPESVFCVFANLSAVLNLTDDAVLKRLETNVDELTQTWRPLTPYAPTQVLADAAINSARFEAIWYQSAPLHRIGVKGNSLAIFRDYLKVGSTVKLYDPTGRLDEEWKVREQ